VEPKLFEICLLICVLLPSHRIGSRLLCILSSNTLFCWLHTLLRRECTERCKSPFGLTFMRNVHELLFTVSTLFGKLDGTVFCVLSHIFEECSFLENSMEQFLTPHFEESSFFCGGGGWELWKHFLF